MNTAWPGMPMYSSRSRAGWPASSSTRNVNIVSRLVTSGCASRTHTIRPAEGEGNALSSPVSGPPPPAASNEAVTVSDTPVLCTRSPKSS